MLVISEYSSKKKKSAGLAYLKKMEEAAHLLGIEVINFERGKVGTLENQLYYKRSLAKHTSVFWLGFVPSLEEYRAVYQLLLDYDLQLINSPELFARSEYFDEFYPFIEEYTIPSRIASSKEEAKRMARELNYPLFIKGAIQSLKKLGWENCVAKDEKELTQIFDKLLLHPSFSLGKAILREYVELSYKQIGGNGIPQAHEYRFFVLNEQVIDYSYYWNGENPFVLSPSDRNEIKTLAIATAKKVKVPFISVDIAETQTQGWKVIEIGDGQFSDIRGISPLKLWHFILKTMNE